MNGGFCLKLLDELLDNGFPFVTEKNVLLEMIKRPTLLRKIQTTLSTNKKSIQ